MVNSIPLLAAGGSAISILFLVIAFVSWLWNVFNSNKNAAGARPQPQPGGGKRVEKDLQAEINRFLKNVMGQKEAQADELEVLAVDETETGPRARRKNRNKRPAAASNQAPTSGNASRPGGRIAQRKGPGSTTLGSGVRQHLADHMQEGRVLQQTQEHFGHGVAEKVQQDMGTFSVAESSPSLSAARTNVTASGVAKLMRDPAGIKQAFVLNLILNRPSFGKRRG